MGERDIWDMIRGELKNAKDVSRAAASMLYSIVKPLGAILADNKESATVISVGQECPVDRRRQWAAIIVTNDGCELIMAAIKPVVAAMANAMRAAGKTIQVTGITEAEDSNASSN